MVEAPFVRLDPPRPLGKLTLLAKRGEGGMASVYIAAVGRGELSRLAAVKVLKAGVPDQEYRQRFMDEAKLVVRLHHNNLVDVREAGEHEGQLYIAMELIEGRDLADVWDQCARLGRAFPVPVAVHVVREVLRGLHYAHTLPGLGLVHRDVSLSNVLIDWAGAVRLADFGLATSALKVTATQPGVVFGKVAYMSPEQALRRQLDGRSDVYACGVILWELLTGRPLRDANVDTQAVARAEAVAPSLRSARIDAELDGVVLQALQRAADERYASADAMGAALSRWLAEHHPGFNQDDVAEFMAQLYGASRAAEHEAFVELLAEHAGPTATRVLLRWDTDRLPPSTGGASRGTAAGAAAGTARRPASPGDPVVGDGATGAMGRGELPGAAGGRAQDAAASGSPAGAAWDQAITGVESASWAVVGDDAAPEADLAPTVASGVRASDPEALPEGLVIAERYKVIGPLGRGGMGRVYVGEHVTVGRSVAIKVLTRAWSDNPDVARRFRDEARAASAARHPNIVEVFDAGTLPDGRLYLVMELLAGRTLHEEETRVGRLEPGRACRIVRDVARAVRAAHEVGIIHRDLKPENVMLVDRGRDEGEVVKVLDFGISAHADGDDPRTRLTIPGHALGTPEYMAPEQGRGHPATPSFDIYALGVILYEALAGETPFHGGGVVEVLARKAIDDAVSLGRLRADLPRPLIELVDRCLARDPARRPSTVAAFLGELDDVLRALPRGPALDTGDAAAVGLLPPRRTSTGWWIGFAAALALLSGGLVVAAAMWVPAAPGAAFADLPPPDRDAPPGLLTGELAEAATAGAPGLAPAAPPSEPPPVSPDAGSSPANAATSTVGDVPASTSPTADTGASAVDEPRAAPESAGAETRGSDPPTPAPARPPAHELPRCVRARQAAEEAARDGAWSTALLHLRERECWPDASDRRRRRVKALAETKDFAGCLREGEGSGDPAVVKIVALCRARVAGG